MANLAQDTSAKSNQSSIGSTLGAKAAETMNTARDALHVATDKISENYGVIRDGVSAANDEVVGFVKKNPLASVLTAVGVGMVIGRALAPRASSSSSKHSH